MELHLFAKNTTRMTDEPEAEEETKTKKIPCFLKMLADKKDDAPGTGIAALNDYLAHHSFVHGYHATTLDIFVGGLIGCSLDTDRFPHVIRWSKYLLRLTKWQRMHLPPPTPISTPLPPSSIDNNNNSNSNTDLLPRIKLTTPNKDIIEIEILFRQPLDPMKTKLALDELTNHWNEGAKAVGGCSLISYSCRFVHACTARWKIGVNASLAATVQLAIEKTFPTVACTRLWSIQ